MAKKTARRRVSRSATETKATPAGTVAVWGRRSGDAAVHPPLIPITVAVPDPAATPLPFKISGTKPAAKVYQPGTSEFRYYAAAAALRRGSAFWGIILGKIAWEVGAVLPVNLDSGADLNAFYTRSGFGDTPGLHFFHDTVSGRTYFSGESPDVVCHEMGHAILDAIRPQLWDRRPRVYPRNSM